MPAFFNDNTFICNFVGYVKVILTGPAGSQELSPESITINFTAVIDTVVLTTKDYRKESYRIQNDLRLPAHATITATGGQHSSATFVPCLTTDDLIDRVEQWKME